MNDFQRQVGLALDDQHQGFAAYAVASRNPPLFDAARRGDVVSSQQPEGPLSCLETAVAVRKFRTERRIEVKPADHTPPPRSADAVADSDAWSIAFEEPFTGDGDRWVQASVAVMAADEIVAFGPRGDARAHRPSVVLQLPERVVANEPVQLLVVDLHDVVECRAPEMVSPLARRRVEVRPAVADDVD